MRGIDTREAEDSLVLLAASDAPPCFAFRCSSTQVALIGLIIFAAILVALLARRMEIKYEED